MMCECGKYFGRCPDFMMDRLVGDILDAHREHALAHLIGENDKLAIMSLQQDMSLHEWEEAFERMAALDGEAGKPAAP